MNVFPSGHSHVSRGYYISVPQLLKVAVHVVDKAEQFQFLVHLTY